MKRFLPLLAALLVLCTAVLAESTDYPVATVNGEALMYSTYYPIETAYLYQMETSGADLADATTYAYFQDLALTYAIEQMLVQQDMRTQGCYDFTQEEEDFFSAQGKAAYEQALQDVMNAMRADDTTDDELRVLALAYAKSLNVTEQTYVDYYRTQYASARYSEWLLRDVPVTDEDVQAEYESRVAQSQALYENDVAAFETALNNGAEVWYKPAGYRSVLQILLPAEGDTEAARLQSVQATVDAITDRLAQGESFLALAAEYGTDANMTSKSFQSTGYQVHQDSVLWADVFVSTAFSPEMAQPGCVSQPFASDLGVHILYYLSDSAFGPVELTDSLRSALYYELYTERSSAAQAQRIDELASTAEVILH